MPRFPYLTDAQAGNSSVVAAIRQRRDGTLLNLDRQLLYSPAFAHGWNTFLGAVRTQLQVDPLLLELAICVVAVLNRAEYEYIHHAPLFLEAGGTQPQIDAVHGMNDAAIATGLFDDAGAATIDLARAMTRDVVVDDDVFARLEKHLSANEIVELVGGIAAYNMVSRFLVALGVEPE